METYYFPRQEKTTNYVLAVIGLAEPKTGKVYTYLTRSLTFIINSGMRYMLILYEYDTNDIQVEPIQSRSDTDMLHAYDVLYDTL